MKAEIFAGGHFAKSDDQKIELDFIAYNVVIKLISKWRHEISNLTVWKIRFIMAGSRKYGKNVWNILDTFPQYW